MNIGQSFDESVAYYDTWVRKAVPGYDDLFAAALQILPFPVETPLAVLDLGAGTGLFSQFVFSRYPNASYVLYDLAEKLLDIARRRFRSHPAQFSYVTGDYCQITGEAQFDLVISSLSIHHLTDEEKAALFCKLFRLLRPGGIFLNIDQIRGETPFLQQLYWEQWLAHVRRMGGTDEEIKASIERRTTYDQDALLNDQLAWLKAAGFSDVDCIYKQYFVGLFFARKR